MADKKTIIEREKSGNGVIYLYKEGIFYKAYEQSCYAFYQYVRQLKLKKRFVKKAGSYVVSLGFPVNSADKLLVGRDVKDFELGIVVKMKDDERIDEKEYEAWKTEVADTTSAPLRASVPLSVSEPQLQDNENDLVEKLRNFPLESRTPLDCMLFVGELKRMISDKYHV